MPHPSRRIRLLLVEGTKVLAVFLGFYLLENQIFHMRNALYDGSVGLAHAHERTSSDLEETQAFVKLAVEDLETSQLDLSRTRALLRESIEALRREREALASRLDERSRELEAAIRRRIEEGWARVEAVQAVAESNAARLAGISASFEKTPEERKRLMLFPTVQLRGNGTVGSGVLVYSERQPNVGDGSVHTTFAITAYHVIAEVLGDRLDRPLDEVHVVDPGDPTLTDVHSARLIVFDKARDIALLRLETTRAFPFLARLMPAARLAEIDIFSPAYAVGCPLGNRPLPTLGEVSSKSKVVGEQVFWMLNAPTFFGNSGGGIYSVPSCELIGVSSMIYTYGKTHPAVVPHMGLFVPLEAVYRWLDDEGFGFIHRRAPIPRHLRWKLAYVEPAPATPRPAALRH